MSGWARTALWAPGGISEEPHLDAAWVGGAGKKAVPTSEFSSQSMASSLSPSFLPLAH